MTVKPTFEIVLFQPEIPPNTGNIIRLCANTGSRLHLIEPLGFNFSNKSLSQIYALPNKMFESFYVGTPVIVNSNSDASRFVNKFNLGWEISNMQDLKNIICKISKKEIKIKSKNALKISKIYNWTNEQNKIKKLYLNLN